MSKLKEIKNLLKKMDLWKEYKNKFQHKKMQLLFSKIGLIFNKDIETHKLYESEKVIFQTKFNEDMFVDVYAYLNTLNNDNYDWKSFGKFIFYIYQTSTYWKDSKHNIKNIFNENNYIAMNNKKRKLYFKWVNSLALEEKHLNQKIINILKKVF